MEKMKILLYIKLPIYRIFEVIRGSLPSVPGFPIPWIIAFAFARSAWGQALEPVDVPAQPLAANVGRLIEALGMVGAPLEAGAAGAVEKAGGAGGARGGQAGPAPH